MRKEKYLGKHISGGQPKMRKSIAREKASGISVS